VTRRGRHRTDYLKENNSQRLLGIPSQVVVSSARVERGKYLGLRRVQSWRRAAYLSLLWAELTTVPGSLGRKRRLPIPALAYALHRRMLRDTRHPREPSSLWGTRWFALRST
jgi:hypothetical protein